MKRFFAILFISLYLYNIVGYLAVFSVIQYRIRSEVKQMLKASVSESDFVKFSFHTRSLERGLYSLRWIDDHEFTLDGRLYDVVRSSSAGDSTLLLCINDTQEEQLFANLDSHVQRQMGHSGQPNKLDSFKDVFKDSFWRYVTFLALLPAAKPIVNLATNNYESVTTDVPFLPPRASM